MSEDHHSIGKPITILNVTQNNQICTDDEVLENMFNHPEVRDRKIVVLSIIGAFRKGKSFFLDYCLRYLYAHYPSINSTNNFTSNCHNWFGDGNEPLKGFSRRSGSDRDTTSITIWDDVFLHTVEETCEKIAIIVMDTQGLSNNGNFKENSKIFALSNLLSSIQVFNIFRDIQEDQLKYLQFATEYAKIHGKIEKPFQNLIFLIRDWDHIEDYDYGMQGGKMYLKSILYEKDIKESELRSVRESIQDTFDRISCCLLPHPGNIVSGARRANFVEYKGNWGEMDEEFKSELFIFITESLNPKNLAVKKIDSCSVTGHEYLFYITKYFDIFKSDNFFQAQTVYEATAEEHLSLIVNNCFEHYKNMIDENLDSIQTEDQIKIVHDRYKNEIIESEMLRRLEKSSFNEKLKKELELKIEEKFEEWSNQAKKSLENIHIEKEKIRNVLKRKQPSLKDQKIKNKKSYMDKCMDEKLKSELQALREKFSLQKRELNWNSFSHDSNRIELNQNILQRRRNIYRTEHTPSDEYDFINHIQSSHFNFQHPHYNFLEPPQHKCYSNRNQLFTKTNDSKRSSMCHGFYEPPTLNQNSRNDNSILSFMSANYLK